MNIEEAKKVLKDNGYFVDNLWQVADVQVSFNCTEEEAQGVLYKALQNEATMEQIYLAIDFHADDEGLIKN